MHELHIGMSSWGQHWQVSGITFITLTNKNK